MKITQSLNKTCDKNRSYYFLYLGLSVSFSVMDFYLLSVNDVKLKGLKLK